jgi:hypothetical protein
MTTPKTLPRHRLILLVTLGTLAFTATPALAVKQYVQTGSFGSAGSGNDQFKEPVGVAVNDSTALSEAAGDVYVVDKGNDRVERFSATGAFEGQFNGSGTFANEHGVKAPASLSSPEWIAVDNDPLSPSFEDVYVTDSAHKVVDKFSATGEYEGQLTGACEAEGESPPCAKSTFIPFQELLGVAVASTGNVWVYTDYEYISINTETYHGLRFDKFSDTSSSLRTITDEEPGADSSGLALDSSEDLFAGRAKKVYEFEAGTGVNLYAVGSGSTLAVVPETGDVLVDQTGDLQLFAPPAENVPPPLQTFATGALAESYGVAVNASGTTVYASQRGANNVEIFSLVFLPTVTTGPASEISSTQETLSGTVDPEGQPITGCEFEYGPSTAEPGHYPHAVECAQTLAEINTTLTANDTATGSVTADLTGLQPGASYHYRLAVGNGEGVAHGEDQAFTSFPSVAGESFSGVGSSSATLHAVVLPGGVLTSYYFEYGTSTEYGSRTPVESAGAGTGSVSVEAAIEGLSPDTAYHFRVVASSTNGVVEGADSVFSTLPVGVLGLPDGRGYELVSSLGNGDASVVPEAGGRAAADGSAVTYAGQSPLVGGNGGSAYHGNGLSSGAEGDNQYLATRAGSGWGAVDIQPDGIEAAGYQSFSSDLSLGTLVSEQALLPGAPTGEGHRGLYTRENSTGAYRLLGENASYAGSTPDGKQILVSHAGTLEEVEPAAGNAYLVSVLPGGQAYGVFGGLPDDLSNVISSDGSRVVWTETDSEGHALRLFVDENVGSGAERTVQVDASQNPAATGGQGEFWTTSSDTSKVFFTDENKLTSNSNAVAGQPDLYEYDLNTNTLTDLTPATTNPSKEHANVVGVLGASSDGSYVYFAAAGSLAATGAAPQTCSPTIPAQHEPLSEAIKCNVYVSHGGEAPRFVAAVTNFDGEGGNANFIHEADWARSVGGHSSFVSDDGRVLVFKSIENLTGFDSREDQEIYSYTYPELGAASGALACISCNPSGVPTFHGESYEVDAELPNSGKPDFALRDLSVSGGRVFFTTVEGLVPQDENGRQDVYEWERAGEGTCVVGGASYSAVSGGCLFVLSGGTSTDESYFLDASETGDDAFIETRSDLVPRDKGEVYEVYDARVGATGETSPSVCTGTGCQGVPAAPPIFATPSSATITGTDDLEPAKPAVVKKKVVKCAKGKKLSKGKCVKQKAKAKAKHRPITKRKARQ